LTAQNTLGVQDIFVVPSEFVKKQINAGLEDVGCDVVKLGLLYHAYMFSGLQLTFSRHAVVRGDN
jgi:hydroxymethylpyrimidine/phosphomethylpyrimidine kinase